MRATMTDSLFQALRAVPRFQGLARSILRPCCTAWNGQRLGRELAWVLRFVHRFRSWLDSEEDPPAGRFDRTRRWDGRPLGAKKIAFRVRDSPRPAGIRFQQ